MGKTTSSRCLGLGLALTAALLVTAATTSVVATSSRLPGYARVLRHEAVATTPLSPWMTDCLMLLARQRHEPRPASTDVAAAPGLDNDVCRRLATFPRPRDTADADAVLDDIVSDRTR